MRRKRLPKGTIMLFVSFMVITVSVGFIWICTQKSKENRLNSGALYSGKQREFTVLSIPSQDLWGTVLSKIKKDIIIYVPIESSERIVRGIYTNGKYQTPPMIRGKFFSEHTSWSEKKYCVIGKNLENDIYCEKNKEFFEYGGERYAVLGVMGTKKTSKLNDMLLLDFKSAISSVGVEAQYVIDGKRNSDIEEALKEIGTLSLEGADIIIPEVTNISSSKMSKLQIIDFLSGAMVIDFVCCLILITIMWYKFRAPLRKVWYINGYEKMWQWKELLWMYGITVGGGILSGGLLFAVLKNLI